MLKVLFYMMLFLSLDVLLYLRLGRKIVKVGTWLGIVTGVWLIVLIIQLPIFNIVPLARLKGFLTLSGMIVQLLLVHYIGRFAMWRISQSNLSEDSKRSLNRVISITTDTAIFGLYFLLYLFVFIIGIASTA